MILICDKLTFKSTIIPLEVVWTQQGLGWGVVPPSVFLLSISTYSNPFSAWNDQVQYLLAGELCDLGKMQGISIDTHLPAPEALTPAGHSRVLAAKHFLRFREHN